MNRDTLQQSELWSVFAGICNAKLFEKEGHLPIFIGITENKISDFIAMVKTKNILLACFRVGQYLQYKESLKLLTIDKNSYKSYDIVIVGSDTLWNVQNSSYPHLDAFLGKGLNALKIVAYAPRYNNISEQEFKNTYSENANFDSFDMIGIRDKQTHDLVKVLSGHSPEIVCDPKLLLDKSVYLVTKVRFHTKYVLVYGYLFKPEEQVQVKKLHGLAAVSIGLRNKWCDYNMVAAVSEFLGYMGCRVCVYCHVPRNDFSDYLPEEICCICP